MHGYKQAKATGGEVTGTQLEGVLDAANGLRDGETVRFEVTSKKTGRTIKFRLRRCASITVGRRFGATGFFVDAIVAGECPYNRRVLNGEPAWGWKVERASKGSRVAHGLSQAIGWSLRKMYLESGWRDGVFVSGAKRLCEQATVRARVSTEDGRQVHGREWEIETVKGPLAHVSY